MGKQPTRPALSQGDEEFLILCAARYCLGRNTSAPWHVLDIVERRLDILSAGCLSGLLRDIEFATPDRLGTELNAGEWLRVKAKIKRRLEDVT